jgi:uncharacterized membrane protein
MTENKVTKQRASILTVLLLIVIAVLTVLVALFSARSIEFINAFLPGVAPNETPAFISGGVIYNVIFTLLTAATDVLYLLGGGVVFFGAILVSIRFIKIKLKDPYQPSGVTRYFSGYLTLSLALFIGAEIIRATTTRTLNEFSVLILIILSRGLFSLILYLERRWHGAGTETE